MGFSLQCSVFTPMITLAMYVKFNIKTPFRCYALVFVDLAFELNLKHK